MSDSSMTSKSSPFPPLRLSDDEKQAILHKIDELLSESLAEYEQFLTQDRATVSELQWKPVKKRDGLSAYRKRQVVLRESDSTKVHTVLVVGETEGTIEDAMLGSVHSSPDLTDAFENYLYRSSTLGSALLCSIIDPAPKSPDRMVHIVWDSLGSLSSTIDSVVKPRDFVMAMATGSTITSTGERISYRFYHSVDVASAPPLPHAIRATRHFTFLHRQVSPDRMHVFIVGRVDPKGRIPTNVCVRISTDGVIETVIRVNCFAAMKKRAFLLTQQMRFHMAVVGDIFPFGIPSDFAAIANTGECAVCGKKPSSCLLSPGKACVVCGKPACSSCFKSKGVIVAPDKEKDTRASFKKLPFCVICEHHAMQLSGWDLSVTEAVTAQAKLRNRANPSFSSTASGSM